MEQKRTKGLAHVREAQPKNRRFAGLGYKSLFNLGPTVWLTTDGQAVNGPESYCRPASGGDPLIYGKNH